MTHATAGRIRCGSRTAAPASWRPRTRWPRSALGASHGYRAFECDVKLSADGVPFLLHDATLERTTDGRGVGRRAAAGASCRGSTPAAGTAARFAGEPLPSLEAIAASACATASR